MSVPNVPMQLMVATKERRADLYINGDITKGFQIFGIDLGQKTDVSYQSVVEALGDLPEEVTDVYVHINSYGGEVAEGVAIYNALRSFDGDVTTVCEGFACSVASVIFMAGKQRVMRDSSLLMLHNASMPATGDANAHRKAADDLDVITGLSKAAYLNHAKGDLDRAKLDEIMDAETWVTAEQALEWGLATEIDKPAEDDEPSQSARELVTRQLTEQPRECVFAQVSFTGEQMDEIASRVLQALARKDEGSDEPDDPDEPDDGDGAEEPDDPDDEDEDRHHRANQRYARIFKNLSNA